MQVTRQSRFSLLSALTVATLFAMVLVGCSDEPTPTPVSTQTDTPAPASTATLIPTATPTPEPTPAPTAAPTAAPTPAPTPTPAPPLNVYESGQTIPDFPMGIPNVVGRGASFQISGGGNVVITMGNGGTVEYSHATYTCVSGEGCGIENGRVTTGAIRVEGPSAAEKPTPTSTSAPVVTMATDYDSDGDDLIEISNLNQLNAIRWDLDGNGVVDHTTNLSDYTSAFPGAILNMGCSASCMGYEVVRSLDFARDDSYASGTIHQDWRTGALWQPIDHRSSKFNAIFDGNGHTIANLKGSGLFARTGSSSLIRNVGMVSADVKLMGGGASTGGLVGSNAGIIVRSYVIGEVAVQGGGSAAGGLVGTNSGAIIASYAEVSVAAQGGSATAGGLVGINSGAIIASHAVGSVAAQGGSATAGGLMGGNSGTINASYAAGSVVALGGSATAGGLIGSNSGAITATYWDTDASGRARGIGRGSASGEEGMTTSELQVPDGYVGIYDSWNVDLSGDGEADNVWVFGTSTEYPKLRFTPLADETWIIKLPTVSPGVDTPTPPHTPRPTPVPASTPTQSRVDGECYRGLVVRPGESCTYPGSSQVLSVDTEGKGRWSAIPFLTFSGEVNFSVTVNGRKERFVARPQGDGSWIVEEVGGS